MYKWLLCWRYLRTRYIALASIVSVTLGVATMIVVNSVMAGFTTEMRSRIHGILSDIVFAAPSMTGFPDAKWHIRGIYKAAGDSIEGTTETVHTVAMLNFQVNGQWITREIVLVGINEETHGSVSDFSRYLQHPENRKKLTFELHEKDYDTRDHQAGPESPERPEMKNAGWPWRRIKADQERRYMELLERQAAPEPKPTKFSNDGPAIVPPSDPSIQPHDPFGGRPEAKAMQFDPSKEQNAGAILGMALATIRDRDGSDRFLLLPGDDVKITFPNAGIPPKAVSNTFTVVDFYESKMSEYDSKFVFVPIRKLQELRGMIDPETGVGNVSAIQIKLKPGADANAVCAKLRDAFPGYSITTWQEQQGPLLSAVQMESTVLNILLFMIIAVAGFGILATFFMIVVEKTRDIGILKSLGASSRGIMGIFLGYGLSLGIVGSGGGMVLGLLFVRHINDVRDVLERLTGQKVFDPAIYYFQKIPTIVEPATVAWIVSGALLIAVIASILPALRAALLHPVEALRYE